MKRSFSPTVFFFPLFIIALVLFSGNTMLHADATADRAATEAFLAQLQKQRANAFLQYFKTGQGDNPMNDFFKEHAVSTTTNKQ